ncbi:MAG: coagulation factor 5/8 type domain protein [Gemmatimonadetes bacterium]|nr:coagulation factor 5/8 type domain protein [Gemmatimonadota bacterium]
MRIAGLMTALASLVIAGTASAQQRSTFANPLDVDYRFMPDKPSRREAADPLITLFGDDYYLFASKSGGYWYSPDMRAWKLVIPEGYPLEDYAPAVVTIDRHMYYTAHKQKAVYTTDDPRGGKWRKIADIDAYADPAFFLDDDKRLYLYFGSALNGSISGVELDYHNGFKVIGEPRQLMTANYADHGWERSGADNLGARMTEGFRIGPYVEGSWMTKHNGTYYLQYAAPGTVWNSYADGVYTSAAPMSGFTYAPYSPFSYKPGGFAGGAGHSGVFQDKQGNYWRVTTMIVSVLHKFERRLGIFPAGFDAGGVMRTNTYLGDYPQFLPGIKANPLDNNRTSWMLLSGGAPTTASSALPGYSANLAVDEDIKTQWSANTGDAGEWLRLDLGTTSTIHALQVNFGEQDTRALGRSNTIVAQYVIEASANGRQWSMLVDRSSNTRDAPHEYIELAQPVATRYVRITNAHASDGRFAVRDLRIFGTSPIQPPPVVATFVATRDAQDDRTVALSWTRVPRATGYVIRYGLSADKLYASYQVGDVGTLVMNSLNNGVTYYFTIDAIGPGGVTSGQSVIAVLPRQRPARDSDDAVELAQLWQHNGAERFQWLTCRPGGCPP